MILGRDLLAELKLMLNFVNITIACHRGAFEGCRTSTKNLKNYDFKDKSQNYPIPYTYENLHKTEAVKQAMDRVRCILDAHYEKANLAKVVASNQRLGNVQQKQLNALLKKHEMLFDRTLGTWNVAPVKLEVKNNTKPYHAPAFLVQ